MPEQIRQQERPELGFVSVGQYLDANKGPLQAGFNKSLEEAQQLGSTFGPLFPGGQAPTAPGYAGTVGQTQPSGSMGSYLDASQKAEKLSQTFGNEYALAGSGRFGEGLSGRGPGNFSAALQFAKYGPQYQALSKYLEQFSPTAVQQKYEAQQTPEQKPEQQSQVIAAGGGSELDEEERRRRGNY